MARYGTEKLVRMCSSLPTCVASQSRVTADILDATQGSKASTSLLGLLNGKFVYKKNEDGTINKNALICSFSKKEFAYHRSCSSLTYHLNAKHVGIESLLKCLFETQPYFISEFYLYKCICIAFLNNAPGLIGLLGCA